MNKLYSIIPIATIVGLFFGLVYFNTFNMLTPFFGAGSIILLSLNFFGFIGIVFFPKTFFYSKINNDF